MWSRKDLKDRSKAVMKRNYWTMFIVTLIAGLFTFAITNALETRNTNLVKMAGFLGLLSLLAKVFVFNPLECGKANFFLKNIEENKKIDELFYFFKQDYLNVVKILLIRDVKIALWTLLLVFPGIIKTYEYRMIPYILSEDSSLSSQEVFARTKELTTGQKANIFFLDLSFIGWYLLGGLLIIGVLFVYPYYEACNAELYYELKALY